MAERALEITGLTKSYGGTRALDDLSFTVDEGAACALVGPNGAGKTTLISILLGLVGKDSGSALIFGSEAGGLTARSDIGYLPDVPSFPGWMRADDFLALSVELSGSSARSVIDPLLEAVGLAGNRNPVRTFSRGMRQRLGLAQALAASPRLLILDEPTSALDPAGQRLFHGLVQSLKGRTTVLYSTHSLNEAERVCDSAIIIDQGRLVRHSTMDDLITGGQGLTIDVAGPAPALVKRLEQAAWVTQVQAELSEPRSQISVTVRDMTEAQQRITHLLAETGVAVHSLRPRTLEEIFLDLTGGAS